LKRKRAITLQFRYMRRAIRRAGQSLRYGRHALNHTPVFFANSFPKSGTHLLTQVMQGFTRCGPAVNSGLPAIVTFEGDTGRQRLENEILADLRHLLPGDIAYGHLHSSAGIAAALCRDGVVPYFILRDPRDVVVSHVHYLTEMAQDHVYHRYFAQELKTFDERLRVSILGLSQESNSQRNLPAIHENQISPAQSLPNIYARFEPYLGWLDCPEVLTLHYEDFTAGRRAALQLIFEHAVQRGFVSRYEPERAIAILADSIEPQRSPTFRSGKTGAWREAFSAENKRLFKEVAGGLLVQLDYEKDFNW